MRRRLLLGENIEYIFSAQTTSRNVSYSSGTTTISITSTANNENIDYVEYSKSGCVTAVTTAATSVTIKYDANRTTSQRSGTLVLKQNRSNKTITITITQQGVTTVIPEYNTAVYGTGPNNVVVIGVNVAQDATCTSKPDWVDFVLADAEWGIRVFGYNRNTSTTPRIGTATIDYGVNTVTITIIQLGTASSVDGYEYATIGGLKWALHPIDGAYEWGAITTSGEYYTGNTEDISGTQYDAARQVMGGSWRMPTSGESSSLASSVTVYNAMFEDRESGIYSTPIILLYNSSGCIIMDYNDAEHEGIWTSTNTTMPPTHAYYIRKLIQGSHLFVQTTHKITKLKVLGVHD